PGGGTCPRGPSTGRPRGEGSKGTFPTRASRRPATGGGTSRGHASSPRFRTAEAPDRLPLRVGAEGTPSPGTVPTGPEPQRRLALHLERGLREQPRTALPPFGGGVWRRTGPGGDPIQRRSNGRDPTRGVLGAGRSTLRPLHQQPRIGVRLHP